eukprot:CAMPEP_0171932516 /NCGR_PEP_ID=MMETSP0993-20121228/30448_1 /TAXON_ID=483369 /ORGANISM="non described non described, Strain CCMP2098" /LENGTH=119 /DNA_ID=CAMNT_0012572825 /DNA_START=186 /DNA_END=541 /DNA_ORIENTATION=+
MRKALRACSTTALLPASADDDGPAEMWSFSDDGGIEDEDEADEDEEKEDDAEPDAEEKERPCGVGSGGTQRRSTISGSCFGGTSRTAAASRSDAKAPTSALAAAATAAASAAGLAQEGG